MSFAGHVLDMISRQKQNRALQKQRRQRYAEKKDYYLAHPTGEQFNREKYAVKSKIEIEKIRKRIQKELREERRIVLIKAMVTLMVLAAIFVLIMA